MSVNDLGLVEVVGHPHLAGGRRAGQQQLADGLATLDLRATEALLGLRPHRRRQPSVRVRRGAAGRVPPSRTRDAAGAFRAGGALGRTPRRAFAGRFGRSPDGALAAPVPFRAAGCLRGAALPGRRPSRPPLLPPPLRSRRTWQPSVTFQQRRCQAHDALGPAERTELLGACGPSPSPDPPATAAQAAPPSRDVRASFGRSATTEQSTLADPPSLGRHHAPPPRRAAPCCRRPPSSIGVGEVAADVAEPGGAEQRLGARRGRRRRRRCGRRGPGSPSNTTPPSTQGRIGVVAERVDVEPVADAHASSRAARRHVEQRRGDHEVVRLGDLQVPALAGRPARPAARGLDHGRVVGRLGARRRGRPRARRRRSPAGSARRRGGRGRPDRAESRSGRSTGDRRVPPSAPARTAATTRRRTGRARPAGAPRRARPSPRRRRAPRRARHAPTRSGSRRPPPRRRRRRPSRRDRRVGTTTTTPSRPGRRHLDRTVEHPSRRPAPRTAWRRRTGPRCRPATTMVQTPATAVSMAAHCTEGHLQADRVVGHGGSIPPR